MIIGPLEIDALRADGRVIFAAPGGARIALAPSRMRAVYSADGKLYVEYDTASNYLARFASELPPGAAEMEILSVGGEVVWRRPTKLIEVFPDAEILKLGPEERAVMAMPVEESNGVRVGVVVIIPSGRLVKGAISGRDVAVLGEPSREELLKAAPSVPAVAAPYLASALGPEAAVLSLAKHPGPKAVAVATALGLWEDLKRHLKDAFRDWARTASTWGVRPRDLVGAPDFAVEALVSEAPIQALAAAAEEDLPGPGEGILVERLRKKPCAAARYEPLVRAAVRRGVADAMERCKRIPSECRAVLSGGLERESWMPSWADGAYVYVSRGEVRALPAKRYRYRADRYYYSTSWVRLSPPLRVSGPTVVSPYRDMYEVTARRPGRYTFVDVIIP